MMAFSPSPGAAAPDDQPPRTVGPPLSDCNLPFAAIAAHNNELQAEIQRLRAERERWVDCQRRIMELLNTKTPERILHDLRNVLNERELYKTLASTD